MAMINSEICAGLSVFLLGFLFFIAGLFNSIWATIFIVDYLIMGIGLATIGVGFWSLSYDRKNRVRTEHHH